VAFAVVLMAFAAAACQPAKPEPPPPRTARVVEADPQAMPISVEGSGQIAARTTTNVGFLVDGRLMSRNVGVGDSVKAGDLLAKLDPTDFQNKLASANSQVAAAEASVAQAAPQEAAKKKLLKDGFTTQADYDNALQALQSAQASLDNAKANQRLAESQLAYATLDSPVGGVVTQTGADAGQVVSAGQMVVQIAQSDLLDAVFAVSARVATAAKIGIPVEVTLQSDPTLKITGAVREIAPNADPVTGTYDVKVGLTDPPPAMRLGALVRGKASVPGDVVIRIPPTALLQTGDKPAVWVVGADGTVHRKDVTVARYDSDAVIVSGGLEKGDLVVAAGVNSLADGQKVNPEKVPAP
jgi:RND family efflux transporter MFP subunit